MMESQPRERFAGPFVWNGPEIQTATDWVFHLSPVVLAEIDEALEAANKRGLTLDDMTPDDFPLPSFVDDIARIDHTLLSGRGAVRIRGLTVDRYGDDDLGLIFWGLGSALGVGVSQSYKGDRLGHVIDIGEPGRYYTVGGELEMHMDPVDVVGLLCLRKAVKGGESRIASSSAVHNVVAEERPDLLPYLYRGFHYSSRPADLPAGAPAFTPHRLPVFQRIGDMPACFYLPIAVRNAADTQGVDMTDAEREALEFVGQVAARPGMYLEMDLQPGDIQFLNNRLVMHSRADYEDPPDPSLKRHLLRLWLMMSDWPARPANMNMHARHDRSEGGIAPTN